jgi:hypothetical protein
MSINVFPTPVTTIAGSSANAYTLPAANTYYVSTTAIDSGIYTISHLNNTSVVCYIEFFNGTTSIGSTQTVSGTISYNLATDATSVRLWSSGGTNLLVTFTKTASALSVAINGTLDTITSTSTYNQTGELFVVVVGGGGGGGRGNALSANLSCGGGGAGGLRSVTGIFNTATSVTIGTGGSGSTTPGVRGNSGGATSFGNHIANGGDGGLNGEYGNNSLRGVGGTPSGPAGPSGGGSGNSGGGGWRSNNFSGNAEPTLESAYPFAILGGSGGGGGGSFGNGLEGPGTGYGGNIGQGGNSNGSTGNANSGTGYGSGGGAAMALNSTVGAGRPGVVYVLRGFNY